MSAARNPPPVKAEEDVKAVISFTTTTPTRPAVLTGKDGGDGYRYVLMPIRSAG